MLLILMTLGVERDQTLTLNLPTKYCIFYLSLPTIPPFRDQQYTLLALPRYIIAKTSLPCGISNHAAQIGSIQVPVD